jgi:hypothetical protein
MVDEAKTMDEAAYQLNLKGLLEWHNTFDRDSLNRARTVNEEISAAYRKNADFLTTLANMTLANNSLMGTLSMVRGQTKESIMFDKITGPETVAMSELQGFRAAERGGVINTEILARMVSNVQGLITTLNATITDLVTALGKEDEEAPK